MIKTLRMFIFLTFSFLASTDGIASCNEFYEKVEPGYCKRQQEVNYRQQQFDFFYTNSFDDITSPHNHNLIANYLDDHWQTEFRANPIQLSSRELLLTAGVAASAVVAFNSDQEFMDFVQENKNAVTEVVADAGEKFGRYSTSIGAGGYIIGVIFKNGEIKRTSAMIVKSGLISGLITRVLKMSFSRKRPNQNEGPEKFLGFDISNEHVSFPSGHTTSAFSFATVISETYKDKSVLIPILAYSAAAIGGWSRVHDRSHWLSDVLIGALIGHLTAKKVVKAELNPNGQSLLKNYNAYLLPVFKDDYIGLNLTIRPKLKAKDNNVPSFFNQCLKYYEENDPFEYAKEKCFTHYLEMSYYQNKESELIN